MANKIKTNPEARQLFNWQGPSGASPGISGATLFTPAGLPNGSGWKSDVYDLGPGVRNNLFEWRAKTAAVSLATPGTGFEWYLATSDDNVLWDANLGSGNRVVLEPEKRLNLQAVGSCRADSASSGVPFVSSGLVSVYARYVAVVGFNMLGSDLTQTAGDHLFQLTPVPDEIQPYA